MKTILLILSLCSNASAERFIREATPSSSNSIYISSLTATMTLGGNSFYSGPVSNVGLWLPSSNTVIGSCIIYSTGSISCPTLSGSISVPWSSLTTFPTGCTLPNVMTAVGGTLTCQEPSNVTGNAATVTNGLYSTGSYSSPSWLTSVSSGIVSGLSASSVAYATNAGAAAAVPAAGVGAGTAGISIT